MATYYVSKLGDDGNDGDGPGPGDAFLTIGAAEDAADTAGDIVYVAPGTYRERVTNESSGTDGNPITFEADHNSRHFGDLVEPGQVRVTVCDENDRAEVNSTSAVWIMNAQTYVTIRGFLIDGSSSKDAWEGCLTANTAISSVTTGYEGQLAENCMFIGGYTCVYGVRHVRRCAAVGYTGFHSCGYVTDSIGSCGSIPFTGNYRVIGCVAFGGYYGFSLNNGAAHCTAYFCSRGFFTNDVDAHYVLSCSSFFCNMGFSGATSSSAYMSPGRCFASQCYTGYGYVQGNNATDNTDTYTEDAWGEPTYWGNCRDDVGSKDSAGHDLYYAVERPTALIYMSNMLEIVKALKMPFAPGKMGSAYNRDAKAYDLSGRLAVDDFDYPGRWRYGHPSGSFKDDKSTGSPHHSGSGVGTDILGHHIFTGDNVSGSAASPALDVGAYAMSNLALTQSSDFYKFTGPGIVIFGGGEKRIGLIVSGGNSITASMYVSCSDSGTSDTKAPFLVLSGSPFFYSSLTAASAGDLIDRGSSWTDGGFQKLTVKGYVSKTEKISLVLSGHYLVTSSFSDLVVK